MAYDYSSLTATALRLITKFGFDMTFRSAGSAGDPATGLGAYNGEPRTAKGVKLDDMENHFPETLIKSGDKAFLIESTTILLSDKWVNGAAFWSVIAVEPVQPNNADTIVVKVLVRA